jgi:hypothetical protein
MKKSIKQCHFNKNNNIFHRLYIIINILIYKKGPFEIIILYLYLF